MFRVGSRSLVKKHFNIQFSNSSIQKVSEDSRTQVSERREAPIRIVLPYKDQKSANAVRKQLGDRSRKVNVRINPVYTSRKIKDEIRVREDRPPLLSQRR